jgi:hypothetical protein
LQPLKWENWQRVGSRSLALQKTNNEKETKKQETKINKKPKTKQPENEKKKQDCTPQWGVVAESWV